MTDNVIGPMTDEALLALAEALWPFANEADCWDYTGQSTEGADDGEKILTGSNLSVGDLRRARTAYESIPSILARVAKAEERVKELEGALKECAADYRSPPCTVAQGAEYLAAEFMRRMEIASAAVRELEDGSQ